MMLASHLVRNVVRKLLVSQGCQGGFSAVQKASISDAKLICQQLNRTTANVHFTRCMTTRCTQLCSKKMPLRTQSCLYSCFIRPGATKIVFLQAKSGVPWKNQTCFAWTKADLKKHNSIMLYVVSTVIFMIGMSYAGVPLYRIFCAATGLGGAATRDEDEVKIASMDPVSDRLISVRFNADVASSMRWNFKPQQTEVKVFPGETALAFYTARNPTPNPINGISTYTVVPYEAAPYFNKIQCFCFEEQRLNPNEQVDMPVFFYIDPEFAEDPRLEKVDTITLSYTFFEAKEGMQLPLPGYPMQQPQ